MDVKLTKKEKVKVLSSTDIYTIMQKVLLQINKIDRNKEHFWTIGLDNANRILYIELISMGTTTSAPVEPMQIYRVAVLKAAVNMILVHNHPSGELKPSKEDIKVTDRLVQVGNILGIEVIDHLIITEKAYHSFTDTGALEKIKESKLFVPTYKIEAQLKKEAEKIGEEKGSLKKTKQIARQLKEKGFTVSQIMELTGITKAEATKLKATKK